MAAGQKRQSGWKIARHYSLMREVIAAIRDGLPSADQMQPGQVFQHVLSANCLRPSHQQPWVRKHMLKHRAWRCVSSIRDGLANGGDDLFHHLPVLHAQIAGKPLFDRHPDIVRDQPSTCSEEDSRIRPSRLDHRLATFFGPDLGEVTKEASRESLASTNGATVQITRLTWFPLGRSADFSYVWHLFSPDNFHSRGWLHWHACGYALANKGIDTRSLQAYLGRSICKIGPAIRR
jgi:hypothetical protein